MPPGAIIAAAAYDASRTKGQDFEDQLGWHNSPLRTPATQRKEPTMIKQAVEWPKPGDIVLDAVYKKVRPGTLAHARTRTRTAHAHAHARRRSLARSLARTRMHANEFRG